MKKTGLLLLLFLVAAAAAQSDPAPASSAAGSASVPEVIQNASNFPFVRLQTPTSSDLYCAGFINKQLMPNANFVAGGLETPSTTKFVNGDIVYLSGTGYQTGQEYLAVRELRDPNKYELFEGQHAAIKNAGQPYSELGRLRILDVRNKMAVAQVEFSCDPVNPGDLVVPFTDKSAIAFHAPEHFDRFAPANGKVSGRIVMAKDFDSELGPGSKVYLNIGANQGLKIGEYFRAVRSYSVDLKDPVDSLSFKASTAEDTQKKEPDIDKHMFTKNGGPTIHVADMPRRAVGEMVIVGTTPTTATGMIVFALEDIHVGDGVELDEE
jgi:hypothetical protein